MSAVTFVAHPRRADWHAPVAAAFVLATVLGGLVDGAAPASAATGSIGGRVFEDTNRSGVFDDGETPWGDRDIWLYDDTGSYVTRAATSEDGTYVFDGLAAGDYTVRYSNFDWQTIWADFVPTTTGGSLEPVVAISLEASTVVDFGWRPIVRSTTAGQPISAVVGPSGLVVESYNDVVPAQRLHDDLVRGLVGPEAERTTVRFDLGSSATASSVQKVDGEYVNYTATAYVNYVAWLTDVGGDTLSHEYGHAWSLFHAYETQQDPEFTRYLEVRGLTGDDRLNTSYGWSVREIIAEDYRQLLGYPEARVAPQINGEIPPADEVPGLRQYLRDDFTTPPSSTDTGSEDTSAPTAELVTPTTDVAVTTAESVSVEVSATDDVTGDADLDVSLIVDDAPWSSLAFDPETGLYVATIEPGALTEGTHLVTSEVRDTAGNLTSTEVVSVAVEEVPPPTPADLAATDTGQAEAFLVWSDVSDLETGYELVREEQHRNGRWLDPVLVAQIDADVTSFTDPAGAGTFRYSLYALNAAGTSEPAVASVTVTSADGSQRCHPKKGC